MICTVHEDDLAAWYRLPEPVGEISIGDFELDEDDFLPGVLMNADGERRNPPTHLRGFERQADRRPSFNAVEARRTASPAARPGRELLAVVARLIR
jgi:hypothetical protein